jgi:endonuclease YncB( thermonuclease family)
MLRTLIALLFFIPTSVVFADVIGKPRIVDADTIWIGKTKIRLHGIDAPEMRQECTDQNGRQYRCGVSATKALRLMVGTQDVRCEGKARDRYKRLIAVCYMGKIDLNAAIVRQGWALAYRRYSKDYVLMEAKAQEAKRGIWSGVFQKPWKWRRRKR